MKEELMNQTKQRSKSIENSKINMSTLNFNQSKTKNYLQKTEDRTFNTEMNPGSSNNLFMVQTLNATENRPEFEDNNNIEKVNSCNESEKREKTSSENIKYIIPGFKKKKLPEADIQRRVNEFRKKMMDEFFKVLSEEKFSEEEREILYNKTTNPVERKRLEKIIQMERALSAERINKLNM